jgi:hypothetical protein
MDEISGTELMMLFQQSYLVVPVSALDRDKLPLSRITPEIAKLACTLDWITGCR